MPTKKTTSHSTNRPSDPWVVAIEQAASEFAARYSHAYSFSDRQLPGIFEIGCFLAIVSDYEKQGVSVEIGNLSRGVFRYLTTPNGNPENFSYVILKSATETWELRQQVRVNSHLHDDVSFTPDIVVYEAGAKIYGVRDKDYAGGKRSFFRIHASSVVTAHECKSTSGFPELYVSFVGTFLVAHAWFDDGARNSIARGTQGHLAPTLFVGGEVSNLHRRMVAGLESSFPMNVVTGLHRGGWVLHRRHDQVNRILYAEAQKLLVRAKALANRPLKLPEADAPAV